MAIYVTGGESLVVVLWVLIVNAYHLALPRVSQKPVGLGMLHGPRVACL